MCAYLVVGHARMQVVFKHIAALCCAVVGATVYLNTLECGICYDDEPAIFKNKDLRPEASWFDLFSHDFWGADITSSTSHKSYRPLTVATFRLNYMLHELQPLGYHLVNVLLHSAVCYLYVLLCGVVFSEVWPALIAGLLFAVHPIHTEAVAGLVGRTELLSGIFFLAAFLAYHRAATSKTQGLKWLGITVLFVLLSFLSKEQGITVVALCVVYDLFSLQKMNFYSALKWLHSPSTIPRAFLHRSLTLAVFSVSFLLTRVKIMKGGPDIFSRTVNPPMYMETPYRQLSWLYLCFVNSWLLLNPWNLCADWRFGGVPLIKSVTDPHNILTLITFGIVVCLGVPAITGISKSAKLTVLGLAFLIIPYLPASNLFFPVGFVVAERVLYLPSMGQCFLVGVGALKLTKIVKNRCFKIFLTLVFVILASLHGMRTFQRNYDWRSNFHVYSSGIKVNPTNGVLLTNLGIEYANRKNFSYAETLYRRAVEVAPDHSKGYGNLGGLLEALGKDEEAEWALRKCIGFGTSDDTLAKLVETYEFFIGTLLMKNESKLPTAIQVLDDALAEYPQVVIFHTLKANVLTRMDRVPEALMELSIASNADVIASSVHYNYGLAYVQQGDLRRATESFLNAVRVRHHGHYYDSLMELGMIYYWAGGAKKLEGENMVREAYNALPKSFLAPFYLGEIMMDQKNYKMAKQLIMKGNSRSKGTYRHILYKLGSLHLEMKEYQSAVDVFENIMKFDASYKDVPTLLKKTKKLAKN